MIEHLEEESIRIAALRNELIAAVQAVIPQAHLSGIDPTTEAFPGEKRLPANAHFTFEGAEGDNHPLSARHAGEFKPQPVRPVTRE